MDDLMRRSVTEQARLVRAGDVSAQELVDAGIAAVEKRNPPLNAVVLTMFDRAREAAKALTGDEPFAGVPILLKDVLAEHEGWPLTEGSRFLEGYVSARDSTLVSRYRSAGFVPIGRTNSPEFASKPTTEPELYGPTHNPWDLTRSAGGSSGGSGAAVAAGMVAVAHANDGGGSTRIPASACGLVGLKPTRGRNPLGPDYGDIGAAGLLCEHVVTRTVLDNALLLDVTAGPDPGAPYFPPPPKRPFADEVGADPGELRIAYSSSPITPTEVHPDCRRAVEETAKLCEELGHRVEEAKPDANGENFGEFFTTVWLGMVAWMIRDWSRRTGRKPEPAFFEAHTWKMFELDSRTHPSDLLLAIHDMQLFAREVAPFFDRYDVWLTPTMTQPPVPLGYFDFDPKAPRQSTQRMEAIPRFSAVANVTGQPAISLPLHWNGEGLPVGIQLMGRYADEATLLRLSAQLEEARPWAHRWPA
jgi:amidase